MAELRKVHQKPGCGSGYPRGKTVLLLQHRPQYNERQRKRPSQPSVGQIMHAEHFLRPHEDSQGLVWIVRQSKRPQSLVFGKLPVVPTGRVELLKIPFSRNFGEPW
jgi:hypothetical protein